MTETLSSDRSWMSVEGYMQALNSGVGLNKLRENGTKHWFVAENESSLLYYNQRSKNELPDDQPEGSIDISSGKLEVFVVLTSNEGGEYLLFPAKDDCITDWLANLKNKTVLEDKSIVPFERDSAAQGGFMSRVRNSFRRKKKLTRSVSEDTQPVSGRLQFKRPSYSPSSTEDGIGELSSLRESAQYRSIDSRIKRKSKRSLSCPNDAHIIDTSAIDIQPQIKKYADKACDTSSLVCLDWIITDGNSSNKSSSNTSRDENEPTVTHREDQSTQTTMKQQAEDALKDALVLLARQMPAGADSLRISSGEPLDAGGDDGEEKTPTDESDRKTNWDKSTMNYANGVMTLQQQKLIRELEMEVCKLKCEVINLIQGTINIPLTDDDLADWHYVEEIRYKDRIFELLREARLYNPSLPNYDSSKSGNFKDGYGFIHGSRESESVVFHYVCRELTQHYSSFYQNKTGHVRFWTEYSKAKKENDDRMLFQEREIKSLVEEGIPKSCRSQVWSCFILEKVDGKIPKKPNLYNKLVKKTAVKKNKLKSEMTEVERQIRCDLLRTMPSNEDYKTLESLGVTKLSRVLHAFVDFKPKIGYLQGMNFLVGLFLLFMDEEDAFWSLCGVVDVYLKHYFDQVLSGVQADQEVLKDLIAEVMPALNAHFKYYGVDISTVTFNWFITVYLDAVPFETAVRIWDCFLFKGREVLFRIAIGLLKLQERSLLQLSGYLEIMQYMKRAARVTYDIDRLFKASFDEITMFPNNEELDEMQKKYRSDIEAKNDFRLTVKHERKRSRVSSFTVEIATPDRSDRLDHVQVVECAVAASKDLSKPVCIPCSVRGETKLYLLDIEKKERSTLEATIDSRVLCADVVGDGTVLIGTVSWYIYAFSLEICEEIWSIQLSDSVIDLCHYDHVTNDKVYAALADGSIAVLPNANSAGPPSEGSHVRIGSAPVMCVTLVDDKVWCGCSNNVVVLETSSLEEVHATVVSPSARHQVARLIAGDHGVWCTIRGSSWIMLIDKCNYDFLLKVDVAFDTTIIDAVNQSQVTVSPFQESRVTTVLPFSDELWVGLGNGQVLIFDIVDNQKSSQESSCDTIKDLDESRDVIQENTGDGYSQTSNTSHEGQERPDSSETEASSELRFSMKMSNGQVSISDIVDNQRSSQESNCDTTKDLSCDVIQENTGDGCSTSHEGQERPDSSENVSNDSRFSMKMRVQYRVSEEAIRSVIVLRETDGPIILSCAGTLSPEGGLSIWEKEATELDSEEWIPCSVRHMIRHDNRSGPATPMASTISVSPS